VVLLEPLELFGDVLEVGVVAGGLGGEVGVASAAVPVALDGLGRLVDLDVEVFRESVHDVPAHLELVCHVDAQDGSDLDLVLAAQHFGVGAGHSQAGFEAVHQQCFGLGAPEVVGAAHGALVGALGG